VTQLQGGIGVRRVLDDRVDVHDASGAGTGTGRELGPPAISMSTPPRPYIEPQPRSRSVVTEIGI